MKQAHKALKVGLLGPMADLYNRIWPDIAVSLDRFMAEVAGRLKDMDFEVITTPLVCTDEQVQNACSELDSQNIDLLIVAMSPYCASGVLLGGLSKINAPVLLWPSQSMFELIPESYDIQTIMLNHGVHAVQDLANVLKKNNISFGLIHGHLQQQDFCVELKDWAYAGRAIRAMHQANPIQLGGYFENMLDLQIGGEKFLRQLSIEPKIISCDEFADILSSIGEKEIQSCIEGYHKVFDISSELTDSLLAKTAKGEIALRQIMTRENSYACGLNFLELCNDPRIADGLHVAACTLMQEGAGYAAEGDWVTAVWVRAIQQAYGIASFSEMFSVDYAKNRLVLKHWGEGNIEMAREKPKMCRSEFNDTHQAQFAIVDFEFQPGRAALLNLNSNVDHQGQLISITGQIAEDHLPKASGPSAVFQPDAEDVRQLLTAYASYGGSHHLALIPSDRIEVIRKISILNNWTYLAL